MVMWEAIYKVPNHDILVSSIWQGINILVLLRYKLWQQLDSSWKWNFNELSMSILLSVFSTLFESTLNSNSSRMVVIKSEF